MSDLKFRLFSAGANIECDYEAILYTEDAYGDRYIAGPLTLTKQSRNEMIPYSNILHFDKKVIQELMNNLWDIGIRPSQMKVPEETLSATQDHLKDMRTIVFEHFLKDKKDA